MRVPGFAAAAAIAVLHLSILAGCGGSDGPETAPAGGVVMYQGRPLAGARVTFIPEKEGSIGMATTDGQGRFELKTGAEPGVAVGLSKATVIMMETGIETGLSKDMTPEDMQMLAMRGELDAMLAKQERSLIPKKYAKPETSGLSFDVKKRDDNQFTIELTE